MSKITKCTKHNQKIDFKKWNSRLSCLCEQIFCAGLLLRAVQEIYIIYNSLNMYNLLKHDLL